MTKRKDFKNFSWQIRVYWQDTDAAKIVYHPNYLNFAQQARSEFMREFVCKESDVLEKYGVLLVVRHAEVDYSASARLDDIIDVTVEVGKIGNSSMVLHQNITRDGTLLAAVKITIVAMVPNGKAVRIPPQLRQIFEA